MIFEKVLGDDLGYMTNHTLAGVGAVNWGLIGITGLLGMSSFNLVEALLGSVPVVENLVYTLVGVAGADVILDGFGMDE